MDTRHTADMNELSEIAERVVGQESSAWTKWYGIASWNPGKVLNALSVALLSLGAPPHPVMLTKDLIDIVLSHAPDPDKDNVQYRRYMNVVDKWYKTQRPYNRRLNHFAKVYGFVYSHSTHDPAQFRKLFAAYLDLHACKANELAVGAKAQIPRRK